MALTREANNSPHDSFIKGHFYSFLVVSIIIFLGLSIFNIRNPVDSGFLPLELYPKHLCNTIIKDKDLVAQKAVRLSNLKTTLFKMLGFVMILNR
uniref:Transmembrane protein n=1 Tax=Heterorhabditis bacteriophora TaxID=37862 RepID=A0A1I7WCP1_HETBA